MHLEILDLEIARFLLRLGLMHELQRAAVVELPDDAVHGELAIVRQRRARSVLAHAGGVDDDGAFRQRFDDQVVPLRLGAKVKAHRHAAVAQKMDGLGKARHRAVGHIDARGHVLAVFFILQVGTHRQRTAASPKHARLRLRVLFPMIGADEGVQRQTHGDGVLGVAAEHAVALGDGRYFAKLPGVGVEVLEEILTGVVEVDLVRSHQRAQRERVVFDELHRRAIVLRRGVQGDVDALDAGVDAQRLGPDGKDAHDRGAAGGDADEVHGRGSRFGRQVEHNVSSFLDQS